MNRFIFSLFIIVPFLAGAQPYTWQWLRSAQGNNSEVVNSICTDPSGNVIVTGYSYSTNFKLAGNLFPNLGNYDFFVASYDLAGNELWAFTGGGIYDDVGKSVTTDALGNVYVAGYFYSPQITVASSATLSSSGLGDGFLLKLDQNGNVLWHKSFGNTGDENINGISSDGSDIFITGYFHSDTIVCGVDTLINAGVNDVFLCKLDGAGSFDWARGLKGVASDAGYAVENDASGNVFVTGTFQGPYLAHANDTLHGQGSSDAFICKFSSTGSMVWAQAAGGIYNDEGYDLASDKSGNIYLTGTYNSPTLTIGNFSLVNQGNFDLFLARFDSMGNTSWILSEGGIFDDTGYGLATDQAGNVYVTGHFHSPSIILGADTFLSQGIGDIYLAAYSSAGSSLWNTTIGGSGDEGTGALATDPWDNLVLGGFFNSPTLTCTADTLVNTGQSDLFIGKLKKEVILTGLNSSALDHEISIYPNPSTGLVTLSAKVTITEVRVYNSNGAEVLREVDPVQEIDLSSLPRGVYFVRIDSGQSTRSRKILLM